MELNFDDGAYSQQIHPFYICAIATYTALDIQWLV